MKLEMTGYQSVAYKFVPEAKVKEVSDGNKVGFFECDLQAEETATVLKVKFKLTIYINQTLDDKKKAEVKTHETRHFTDCKTLAVKLKTDLEKVLKEKRDPEIGLRIEWFHSDRCKKAAAFHREGEGYSIEICPEPTSPRPK